MCVTCNHDGEVCLVHGRSARALCIWTPKQLMPDMVATPVPMDLNWSPDGETLVVSRVGHAAFLHFGPEVQVS